MEKNDEPIVVLVEELGDIMGRLDEAVGLVRALGYPPERERMLVKGIAFAITELDTKTLLPLLRERPDLDRLSRLRTDSPRDAED